MKNTNDQETLMAISSGMADAVETAAGFTVLVDARRRMPVSGVLYREDLVLTVEHGIETDDQIRILLADGSVVPGTLVGRDPSSDLALVRIAIGTAVELRASQSSARVGQPVIAVGRPEPEGIQASFGIVTSMGDGLRTMRGSVIERYIATDATPYPGFSGGPLISLSGEVLGINTSGLVGGSSLAIPVQIALSVAAQLESYGKVRRGFLGVRSQRVEIGEALGLSTQVAQKTGLLLVGVEAGGPADLSKLLVGDILIEINGRVVTDQDDLFVALTGEVVGKTVPIKILRGGQLVLMPVTVGEKA